MPGCKAGHSHPLECYLALLVGKPWPIGTRGSTFWVGAGWVRTSYLAQIWSGAIIKGVGHRQHQLLVDLLWGDRGPFPSLNRPGDLQDIQALEKLCSSNWDGRLDRHLMHGLLACQQPLQVAKGEQWGWPKDANLSTKCKPFVKLERVASFLFKTMLSQDKRLCIVVLDNLSEGNEFYTQVIDKAWNH